MALQINELSKELSNLAPEFDEVEHDCIQDIIKSKLAEREQDALTGGDEDVSERPFAVADLRVVRDQLSAWQEQLPRVKPFYAVKCNDDIQLIKVLAGLGIGFDCASKAEIERVLSVGVSPQRIIYANPCKQVSFVRYAARVGVYLMTFDNGPELVKIKKHCPKAKLVLRLLPPATDKVQCELGNKFGCPPDSALQLLEQARRLRLDVAGVSFHVGSGCYDLEVFPAAVRLSAELFKQARNLGFRPWLLDVGGGFPGTDDGKVTFPQICDTLLPALDEYFPAQDGVTLIAEPGRFFAAAAFSLAACVIAVRDAKPPTERGGAGASRMYYLNDGVYGSFNCLLYDHAHVEPVCLVPAAGAEPERCSVWGPTCDGLDVISESALLPRMEVGDWVMFKNMGAYTLSAGSSFNGMPPPDVYYVWTNVDTAPPPSIWLLQSAGLEEPAKPCASSESAGRTGWPAAQRAAAGPGPAGTVFVSANGTVGRVTSGPPPAASSLLGQVLALQSLGTALPSPPPLSRDSDTMH